uniref:Uncharacterized protein n=1 Tax=Athene cunicularia TaxID=194338 RepID=A0A663LQC4_ATHCN
GPWPGLGAELRSQVAQGQRQCQELQDKLAASEATVRAQAEQLEKYHILLRELKPQSLLCSLGGLAALWTPCLWIHPRKYDSLIQAQARELSHLRQTLREGRGVSRSLAQHLRDALRSFEDLLRGTDIDYYLGQGFRKQLAQGRQLAERLSDKLGTSKYLRWGALGLDTGHGGLGRDALMDSVKGWGHLSSRSATSSSFVSEGLEPCSDGDVASECSQCRKEPARLAGTAGCPGPQPRAGDVQHLRSTLDRDWPCGTVPQCQPGG